MNSLLNNIVKKIKNTFKDSILIKFNRNEKRKANIASERRFKFFTFPSKLIILFFLKTILGTYKPKKIKKFANKKTIMDDKETEYEMVEYKSKTNTHEKIKYKEKLICSGSGLMILSNTCE